MNRATNTVQICGWNATGKGVLAKLLDGHPELGVIPFDDSLASAFARVGDAEEFRDLTDPSVFHLKRFYEVVAESQCRYHRIQSGHHGLPLRLAPSVENVEQRSFEEFDFYEFEEDWVNTVSGLEEFDPYRIMTEIYHSFFSQWDHYPYNQKKCAYYVGFGGKEIDEVEFLIKNGSKVIFVYRDPRGITASMGDKDIMTKDTIGYLKYGHIYEIQLYHEKMIQLSKKYPDDIHVVSFEELITEHESTVESVRDFLDISENPILNEPTLCGEGLPGVNYVGSINDRWEDMMSEDEQRVANLQLGETSLYNIRPKAVYYYLYALSIVTARSTLKRIEKRVRQTMLYSYFRSDGDGPTTRHDADRGKWDSDRSGARVRP